MNHPNDHTASAANPLGSATLRSNEEKTRSSQNALKHVACSTELLLPGEDPHEFAALKQTWFDEYNPSHATTVFLVLEVIRAQWLLLRQTRRYNECEQYIAESDAAHPMAW